MKTEKELTELKLKMEQQQGMHEDMGINEHRDTYEKGWYKCLLWVLEIQD